MQFRSSSAIRTPWLTHDSRQQRKRKGGKERLGKPQAHPLQIEIAFGKRIEALFDRLAVKALSVAKTLVRGLTADASKSESAELGKKLAAEVDFGLEEAKALVRQVANQNAQQMKRALGAVRPADDSKSLALQIPELSPTNVLEHAKRTVRELESVTQAMADRITPVVQRAVASGVRGEVLAKELEKQLGLSKAAAKRAAIGQVIRINSAVTRERHEALGVTEYIWRSTDDAHTRAWHRKLNKTRQSYDSPPIGGGGGPKDRGHPGSADVCRCQAIPVLDAPARPAAKGKTAAELKTVKVAKAEPARGEAEQLEATLKANRARIAAENERIEAIERQLEAERLAAKAELLAEAEARELAAEAARLAHEAALNAQRAAVQQAPLVKSGQELTRTTKVQFKLRGPETAITAAVSSALDRVGFRTMHSVTPGRLQFTDVSVKIKKPGGQASDRLHGVKSNPKRNEVYDGAPGFYSPTHRMLRASSNPDHYNAGREPLEETVDTTQRQTLIGFDGSKVVVPVGVPGGTRHIAKTVAEDAEMVAVHEFGHSVHLNHPDKLLRAAVDDIVEAAYADPRREAVSAYGDEKPREFFAEAFTAYWHYPPGWMRRNAPKMLKMVEDVLQLRGMPLNPAA